MGMVNGSEVITIERFIMEQERLYPEATGELSNLLYDLCLAAKIISRHVRRAGLSDILGAAGGRGERLGRSAAEARPVRQRDGATQRAAHRPGVCDGLRGGSGAGSGAAGEAGGEV